MTASTESGEASSGLSGEERLDYDRRSTHAKGTGDRQLRIMYALHRVAFNVQVQHLVQSILSHSIITRDLRGRAVLALRARLIR